MSHPLGNGASQGASSMGASQGETIRRDIRDASEATGAALDSVAFIAREALTSTQEALLAAVVYHIRKALAGLDAMSADTEEDAGAGGPDCYPRLGS